ncbi:methionyl-tRNA formyltransferase [Nakamurella panacisegetis]|uniref:Methionyl-tRNA formyltransferase n=1 Tax=Nakamurella panacisegetis TaxID=1090615 RepID=A0A1H0PKY2_9ACTN|nr:methionyl-tRNA formyltransferase [Nakamurella panacisegetis]SDP05440.1 methionyl-tRNA formyltransferase [Nakamurella panacisegetis]
MRIVFAGTPAPAVPSLLALLESAHDVVAVISRPDAPTGRGRRTAASPVAELARERGIELLTPVTARDPEFVARLAELAPDAAAVVAYGAILRPDVLDIPTHGWVNLHFSLLPAWRGAAPVQAAIRAGDDITGATTFRLEAGLDTGPVYGIVTEPIAPNDTAGTLLDRLARSGARLLVATMDGIADGSLRAVEQSPDGISHAAKITVADAQVDWTRPAVAVDRMIRSVTPAPGAWSDSRWGRIVIGPVEPTGVNGLAAGEIQAEKKQVLVGTGTTAVRLTSVQPTGKKQMAAADWARGVRPAPGDVLGSTQAESEAP